jgi:2-polyprenyl-6-methoxyphenol hydroxylase-like FAD-dependent oxidoreductase
MQTTDVVIVGGGIGGSALGAALARAGLGVSIFERTTEFEDRVRGEWIAPWGVAEAKSLGLYETLLGAGGHHLSRHISYDELAEPAAAEARAIPIAALHPASPGPLCLEHVRLQNALIAEASAAGAHVQRGVRDVKVRPGSSPTVAVHSDTGESELRCRWIVGADGRASSVRRQIGIPLEEDPVDHLIAGLLIDDCAGWPDDLQAMGKVGDIAYLVFPQGQGKVRLYADFDVSDRGRFAGADGAREMLAAFQMPCVPKSEHIAAARPIGPCRSYPSQDAWTDRPFVEGAVLMGDAAGYNDPIIGQGLSITLRDARWIRDLLTGGEPWCAELFAPYAEERRERLRRLRATAAYTTRLVARFDEKGIADRKRAFERLMEKPEAGMIALASFSGPEKIPAEYFTPGFLPGLFDA